MSLILILLCSSSNPILDLPLTDKSVDVVVSDLPFGHIHGQEKDMYALYPKLVHLFNRFVIIAVLEWLDIRIFRYSYVGTASSSIWQHVFMFTVLEINFESWLHSHLDSLLLITVSIYYIDLTVLNPLMFKAIILFPRLSTFTVCCGETRTIFI